MNSNWEGCMAPHDPHFHWHSEAQMKEAHIVSSVAQETAGGAVLREAVMSMTYNEAGVIGAGALG